MRALCADLELHHVAKVGHWLQQEAPDVVNGHLLAWLRRAVRVR
jgi:pimeloyl-ACP methyl ester carboxylesterase